MKKQKIAKLLATLPPKVFQRGWQIDVIGERNDLWFASASFNPGGPFMADPMHGVGFMVKGCKSKQEAIQKIADLIRKQIEDWSQVGE